ncbi:tautomerase family protein [Nocardia tengchongensis]|uniref:Tautomerase family protein n=2 Tax=Nocardia tengchongensis TaxID=2055889 RepID=A0ABX8CQW8_9NOCA|nr:tautomerase family protein [Nocardia tengchongensis]QVI22316.1 tautomerase family protein [Nocardia tengchongensis]
MPMVTIKTVRGQTPEALARTMREVSRVVAENLGYDPAHVWVMLDEMPDDHFMVAGKTWAELKSAVQ